MKIKRFLNAGINSGLLYSSTQDSTSSIPIISSVSQNAGTIDGGSVLTVSGLGFEEDMTSNLGTVSGVTPSSCTIVTNANSVGAFSWDLQTFGGNSAIQSFTYLSHPATPSISPVFGPDNATQNATIFSTNLPFGYTGVPVSGSVGGLTLTSFAVGSSTQAAGLIPSGGSDGLAAVVITVDGVSASASNIYTFRGVPTISSVSRNAGTIDGGGTVNVTGTQFFTGMTSTLGAVSAITATTCTITTNSHSAGAFSWTLTNTTGVSANQSYTYLAHPGTPTVSPLFGPDNATNAVTFTSSSLPFGFSGVPFSCTVGGLTVTSLSATGSTTATGTIPSGGSDGLANIVITVDGVSATGTNGYTFRGIPTVSSVSQNAGTLDGNTAVSVTGTQFFTGMTSTLGAVSAITATTCTITTNSHSAGAFSWTLTNTTGVSANQSYTYLAHPGVPSSSPNSGPDNATQAVTFTSSALPFGFSGVPFSCTVGGLTVTSLSATGSTTATGTIPSGGSDGAQNIIITVDGISTTGTGGYTFINQRPTITSFQAATPDFASAAGQTQAIKSILVGTFFTGATSIKLNGVEHISQSTVTATTVTFNSINAGTAGAFTTVTVITPLGTATYGNGTSFGWTYLPAGYHLYRGDLGITFGTGTKVQTWADQGDLTANDAVQNTGGSQPTQATGSAINSLSVISVASGQNMGLSNLNTTMTTAGHVFRVLRTSNTSVNSGDTIGSAGATNGDYYDFAGGMYDGTGRTTRGLSGNSGTGYPFISSNTVYEIKTSSSNWSALFNGTSILSTGTNTVGWSTAPKFFRNVDGGNFIGIYEEVLMFNTVLSAPNRAIVVAYLYGRTGISGT